jgi:hypothetical protein
VPPAGAGFSTRGEPGAPHVKAFADVLISCVSRPDAASANGSSANLPSAGSLTYAMAKGSSLCLLSRDPWPTRRPGAHGPWGLYRKSYAGSFQNLPIGSVTKKSKAHSIPWPCGPFTGPAESPVIEADNVCHCRASRWGNLGAAGDASVDSCRAHTGDPGPPWLLPARHAKTLSRDSAALAGQAGGDLRCELRCYVPAVDDRTLGSRPQGLKAGMP